MAAVPARRSTTTAMWFHVAAGTAPPALFAPLPAVPLPVSKLTEPSLVFQLFTKKRKPAEANPPGELAIMDWILVAVVSTQTQAASVKELARSIALTLMKSAPSNTPALPTFPAVKVTPLLIPLLVPI